MYLSDTNFKIIALQNVCQLELTDETTQKVNELWNIPAFLAHVVTKKLKDNLARKPFVCLANYKFATGQRARWHKYQNHSIITAVDMWAAWLANNRTFYRL